MLKCQGSDMGTWAETKSLNSIEKEHEQYLMCSTSQKIDFTFISKILDRPSTVVYLILLFNSRTWPGNFFAIQNFKLA